MKTYKLYLVMLAALSLLMNANAQQVEWIKGIYYPNTNKAMFFPSCIDSNNDILVLLRDCTSPRYNDPYLLKYDMTGNFLGSIYIGDTTCYVEPNYIDCSNGYYKVLESVHKDQGSESNSSIPRILTVDNGLTKYVYDQAYKMTSSTLMFDTGYVVNTVYHRFHKINNKYYVPYIKDMIQTGPNSFKGAAHYLLACYDESGNVIGRYGSDTTTGKYNEGAMAKYIVDSRLTYDNHILTSYYHEMGDKQKEGVFSKIIETDTNGQKIFKLSFIIDTSHVIRDILKINETDYICNIIDYGTNQLSNSIQKIDTSFRKIKQFDLSEIDGYVQDLFKLEYIENHILIWGHYNGVTDGKYRFILLNENLELIKDYIQQDDYISDEDFKAKFRITNILPLNKYEHILYGGLFNGSNLGFIAKINLNAPDKVTEQKSDVLLSVSPNPFKTVFEIKFENIESAIDYIDVYSADGARLMSLKPSGFLMSGNRSVVVSGASLPAGVYYIEASAGGKIYRAKAVKE